MSLIHFLLIYDLNAGRLLRQEQFSSADAAAAAYGDAEREHVNDDRVEIVLIGSDSIETIHRTHGHYFVQGTERPVLPELATV